MVRLMASTFEAAEPVKWVVIGLLFCISVGIIYAMLPAIKASRLNHFNTSNGVLVA